MFSILRNNKKGALELSMNAIVIIVLAFAMLGLGLVFTRTLLGQATQGAGEVTGTAKQQILDSLREGNKKLSAPQEIKVQAGDSTILGIGLKNTGDGTASYTIKLTSLDGTTPKEVTSGTLYTAGSKDVGTFTFTSEKSLDAQESDVIPIRFAAKSTGTRLFDVKVHDDTNDKDYATATIFVTIQ